MTDVAYLPAANIGAKTRAMSDDVDSVLSEVRLHLILPLPLSRRVQGPSAQAHVAPAARSRSVSSASLRPLRVLRCRRPSRLIDRASSLVAYPDVDALPSHIATTAPTAITPHERGRRDGSPPRRREGPSLIGRTGGQAVCHPGPFPTFPSVTRLAGPPVRQGTHYRTAPGPAPHATASSAAAASSRPGRGGPSGGARSPLTAATASSLYITKLCKPGRALAFPGAMGLLAVPTDFDVLPRIGGRCAPGVIERLLFSSIWSRERMACFAGHPSGSRPSRSSHDCYALHRSRCSGCGRCASSAPALRARTEGVVCQLML